MRFLFQMPPEVKVSPPVVLGPLASEPPVAVVEIHIPGLLPQDLINQNL